MSKVKVRYAIKGYYKNNYKTKTIEIDLPKNEYGFILFKTLGDNIKEYINNILKIENFYILNYQVQEVA